MFQNIWSIGGTLLIALVTITATPGPAQAAPRGGGFHGGGFRGGAHYGGFRGGISHRSVHFSRPYTHYGYRPYYRPYYRSYGYYPYYNSYPYYYPYNYSYYPNYSYTYPYVAPSLPDDSGYSSSYGTVTPESAGVTPSAAAPAVAPQPDTSAHVTVRVPADARLWFNGTPTTTTGRVRQFDSPLLTPGTPYSYQVRASWKENGREVTQTQTLAVTAGANVRADFPVPTATAGQASNTNQR